MEFFKNHNLTTTEITVVSGTITNEENELGSDTDIFYWANFIPHFDNKTIFIMGECGTNEHNKSRFFFVYNKETDTVMIKDYRFSLCSPEIYEKYYLNIKYITPRNDKTVVISHNWLNEFLKKSQLRLCLCKYKIDFIFT